MLTKEDFKNQIKNMMDDHPEVQVQYLAGDPRVIQHIDAMATMLAMLSTQIELSYLESFRKSRDSTVLADAALRGIVPRANPTKIKIALRNDNEFTVFIGGSRSIIDSNGNLYLTDTSVTIEGLSERNVTATQIYYTDLSHVVSESYPFYEIAVPKSKDGSFLSTLTVSDKIGYYDHREKYVNTMPDERVFHIEADDRLNTYVRLGYRGVVGYQPEKGEIVKLRIGWTKGKHKPETESPLVFEKIESEAEVNIKMKVTELMAEGTEPHSMTLLRDLSQYPSVYDSNAVFLGEFDFLVRRNFPDLKFLSVWNEAAEERVRGASVDNINCLFVACVSESELEPTVIDGEGADLVIAVPTEIHQRIEKCIKDADDSYKVKFRKTVIRNIEIEIKANISAAFSVSEVQSQIRTLILRNFGKDSMQARRGNSKTLYKRIYELVKQEISALTTGESDLTVKINEPEKITPEMWRFVSDESLKVVVETSNVSTPAWGI